MTTSTSAFEPAADVYAKFDRDYLSIAGERSRLAKTTFTDAGRLDSIGRCFVSAPVRSSLVLDAEGFCLLIRYNQWGEFLSIMSLFTFVAQYPDR